jgi:CheY-like chemotaxis protein
VLLCTGYSDVVDEGSARSMGVSALLAKPVDRLTLATTVQRTLARSQEP